SITACRTRSTAMVVLFSGCAAMNASILAEASFQRSPPPAGLLGSSPPNPNSAESEAMLEALTISFTCLCVAQPEENNIAASSTPVVNHWKRASSLFFISNRKGGSSGDRSALGELGKEFLEDRVFRVEDGHFTTQP